MLNPFVMRKWAALLLNGALPTVLYAVFTIFYGLWWGLGMFMAGLFMSAMLGNVLFSNPFTKMLEGKGILAIDLNSTGIMRPFIVGVRNPYIYGRVDGQKVKDVFDRDAVFNMSQPQKVGWASRIEKSEDPKNTGGLKIEITEEEFNRGRFAMFQYPVIIYNSSLKSILTKDMLSEIEKTSFVEHTVLYLNRNMEELTGIVRDFARHVVESLKPRGSFFSSWIVWVILAVVGIIFIVLFGPAIWNAISGLGGVADTGGSILPSNTITPR